MKIQRKLLCSIIAVCTAYYTNAQQSKIYIDLGPNDVTNGNITTSPDVNGNYWNNLINETIAADTVKLVDNTNTPTGIGVKVTQSFQKTGILNGGLLAPSAALLGDLAINTATQDYFFGANCELKFSGLSKNKKYVFHFFGSRAIAETRVSQYKLIGANTSSTNLQTSGTGVGAGGYNGNNNTIANSDTVFADANGVILLDVIKITGTWANLNCIKIETFNNTNPVKYTLDNQGFEQGNLNLWSQAGGNSGSIATVGKDLPHQGVYSLKIGGSSFNLNQKFVYINNLRAYTLSGYFYKPSTLSFGQSAYLTLAFYDKNNLLLGSAKSDSVTSLSTNGVWIKLQTTLTIPVGTYYVQGTVNWVNATGVAGNVYFDDMALDVPPLDPLKIAYMGSSVAYGQGATNFQGYNYLYTQLLNARQQAGGLAWTTVNISVPGNNTTAVLNRYASDLLPQKVKYVIFGLSLGNEGIHETGQPAFNSFKANLLTLVLKAKQDGMVPIVTNCYDRNDYTATDYAYTKQMDALIAMADVPSVNLLGALDNLSGHYVDGYWADGTHPNDIGHAELFYTMVPSLFDALDKGKPVPKKVTGSYITLVKDKTTNKSLSFAPENIVHPFTTVFSFKTALPGTLLQIKDAATGAATGTVAVNNGLLVYASSKGGSITGTTKVDDNSWHKLTITHYYALGKTLLYCDSTLQGTVDEKLLTVNFKLGGPNIPQQLQYKNFLFYRSGMNIDEVKNMVKDSLLKSSLELYAPLDGKKVSLSDSLVNLAQSTNTLALLTEKNPVSTDTVSSFTVGGYDRKLTLNWKTVNTNNYGFQIQSSTDNSNWQTLANVAGNGTNSYQATIDDPHNGVNYFRMIVYDANQKPTITGSVKYNIVESATVTGFTAAANNGHTDFTISTSSERFNHNFYVARSADSVNWQQILSVQGAGITNEPKTYTISDSSPLPGKNYYVLVYYLNGTLTYSAIKVVDFTVKADAVKFSAYPNPTPSTISFSLKGYSGRQITATLSSLYGKTMGKEIFTTNSAATYTLKAKPASGTYILNITGTGLSKTSRVMVQ